MPKNLPGFTPKEQASITHAQNLMKRCMNDDTPTEVFSAAVQNYNNVMDVCVAARTSRHPRKSFVKKLFNK